MVDKIQVASRQRQAITKRLCIIERAVAVHHDHFPPTLRRYDLRLSAFHRLAFRRLMLDILSGWKRVLPGWQFTKAGIPARDLRILVERDLPHVEIRQG